MITHVAYEADVERMRGSPAMSGVTSGCMIAAVVPAKAGTATTAPGGVSTARWNAARASCSADRLEVQGPMSIGELSDAFGLDASTLNRQAAAVLRAVPAERVPARRAAWPASSG